MFQTPSIYSFVFSSIYSLFVFYFFFCFLLIWLQSPSAVILEPKKIKPVIVSPSIRHEVTGLDAIIFIFWTLRFLFYFTILYWFCHILTWIHHECTCLPHSKSLSHFPPHPIPLSHPSAPALSALYHALNLDWQFVSHMIIYMFQCHSPISSHPRPLPQSLKDCSIHLCLFRCLTYRVIITIFLNSIYMH